MSHSKKSNHRHEYVRHIKCAGALHTGNQYDVVNVCSICGRVKDLPFRDRLVKEGNAYVWPYRLEDIRKYFGDLPMLTDE